MAPKLIHFVLFVLFHFSSLSLVLGLTDLSQLIGCHKGQEAPNLHEIKEVLTNLGYLDYKYTHSQTHEDDDFFDGILESAVKDYQTFYNLNVTGILDLDTVTLLDQPRCGVADVSHGPGPSFGLHAYRDFRHYTIGSKVIWPPSRRNLTYSVKRSNLQPFYIKNTIYAVARALKKWGSIVGFSFTHTEDYAEADLKFSFQRRDHGDGFPFDGPGKVLAHAFYPTAGVCHFDADDLWSLNNAPNAHDFETVALHEIGHLLGLGHSNLTSAVMYAYINYGERKGLSQDDIQGIKAIYKPGG